MGGVCARTANAGECESPRSRAVWRRWRWVMKCFGRQTRPTYSPERRALHLFGNRFPLRPEHRPVLSWAWYDDEKKRAAIAGRPRGFGVVIDEAPVAAQLGNFTE